MPALSEIDGLDPYCIANAISAEFIFYTIFCTVAIGILDGLDYFVISYYALLVTGFDYTDFLVLAY